MTTKELREKSTEDLASELAALQSELFNLRFQHATHQLENTAQLRTCRRNIARVKTIMRERELQQTKQA